MGHRIEGGCWMGADLGGSNLRVALLDPRLRILERWHRPTGDRSVEGVVGAVAAALEALQARGGHRARAVGIGVPGLVEVGSGTVIESPNFPGWRGVPIGRLLERRLGIPVHVENDVNAIAVGEHRFGAARGCGNLLVMALGTGVGGGLILGGALYRGVDGTAGEVGHVPVYPRGRPCRCGSRGCLEAYASATAVAEAARAEGLQWDPADGALGVARAARGGNPVARRVLRTAGTAVGIAAAGLANLLNLEAMVVGGGLAGAWDLMEGPARSALDRRSFRVPARRLRMVRSELGDDAGVIGAAALAREEHEARHGCRGGWEE